ncbi:MAG: hypothetical protein CMQ16_11840 [Gammaproteobacteria bacterium]|nr:hypothetical protein [Gammaproteobacteria bacterium]
MPSSEILIRIQRERRGLKITPPQVYFFWYIQIGLHLRGIEGFNSVEKPNEHSLKNYILSSVKSVYDARNSTLTTIWGNIFV